MPSRTQRDSSSHIQWNKTLEYPPGIQARRRDRIKDSTARIIPAFLIKHDTSHHEADAFKNIINADAIRAGGRHDLEDAWTPGDVKENRWLRRMSRGLGEKVSVRRIDSE